MYNLVKLFTDPGGRFVTPFPVMKNKAAGIRAAVFDWNGVFNNGTKTGDEGSPFSEPDTMGLNMLKLNHWLRYKTILPTFIITGENNQTALKLARRENMNAVFLNYIYKPDAIDIICEKYGLKKSEMVFVFDDILDIEVAKQVGVSILVNRESSPLTKDYVVSKKICDYVTGNSGGNTAVREACELLIGMTGSMSETIETRIRYKGAYEKYLAEKSLIEPEIFKKD